MTAVEAYPLDGGAGSRVADDAIPGREVMRAPSGTGIPSPGASSATRCPWCERPSGGPTDPQHAPCLNAELRMDRDLASARQPTNQHLGIVPW